MRIDSNLITEHIVSAAARIASVGILENSGADPTVRLNARKVELHGSHPERRSSRYYMAPTWDEAGIFIAELFALDPDAIIDGFAGSIAFHKATGQRFRSTGVSKHHHTWGRVEGQAHVECVNPHCDAIAPEDVTMNGETPSSDARGPLSEDELAHAASTINYGDPEPDRSKRYRGFGGVDYAGRREEGFWFYRDNGWTFQKDGPPVSFNARQWPWGAIDINWLPWTLIEEVAPTDATGSLRIGDRVRMIDAQGLYATDAGDIRLGTLVEDPAPVYRDYNYPDCLYTVRTDSGSIWRARSVELVERAPRRLPPRDARGRFTRAPVPAETVALPREWQSSLYIRDAVIPSGYARTLMGIGAS